MLVTDLDLNAHWLGDGRDGNPVHLPHRKMGTLQVAVAAYDYTLRGRFRGDNVQWFSIGDLQTAALADGEAMHARMFA